MENLERINAEIEKLIDENSSSQDIFLEKMRELFEVCLKHITGKEFDIDTFYETLPVKLQKDFRFLKTLYVYYFGSYKYDKKFDEEDTDATAIEANAYGEKDESDISENEENEQGFSAARIYPQLFEFKKIVKEKCGINILVNLEKLEPKISASSKEYYRQILEKLNAKNNNQGEERAYYITKIKSIIIDNEIIYEISLMAARNEANKFNRFVAFSRNKINDNYTIKAKIKADKVKIKTKDMLVFLITESKTAIRPCEFENFSSIFHENLKGKIGTEIDRINAYLDDYGVSLFDIVKFSNERYADFKEKIKFGNTNRPIATDFLDKVIEPCKSYIDSDVGKDLVRYLLYIMRNNTIKGATNRAKGTKQDDYTLRKDDIKSKLLLSTGCFPFTLAPFCMNPPGQGSKTRLIDLLQCLNPKGREDEFLYNRLNENTEAFEKLYTDEKYLQEFKDFDLSILKNRFNNKKITTKQFNKKITIQLSNYGNKYFIRNHEDTIIKIIEELQNLVKNDGVENYKNEAEKWLKGESIDDPQKVEVIENLFAKSKIAFIYGAAGTGKSTLMEYISQFHKNESQIFLAHTGSATQNLRDKITKAKEKGKAMTIASFLAERKEQEPFYDTHYDIIFIDECSMVSNKDMLDFLNKANFDKLVLVGDNYQIDAIQYGSWFNMVKIFLPQPKSDIRCQFELKTPYRAANEKLLEFYNLVREAKTDKNIKDKVLDKFKNDMEVKNKKENLKKEGVYFYDLDKERENIFNKNDDDEIILCLNYDGLDGINNMNMFLQDTKNTNKAFEIGVLRYKIGDPIVFTSANRFYPLYNNLKGKIVNIVKDDSKLIFEIEVERTFEGIEEGAEIVDGLTLVKKIDEKSSIIKFAEEINQNTDDDIDVGDIPFALAYAVSIHKSQGLEYKSVKVIITDEARSVISHNIFYTAITRAKECLEIYCSYETLKYISDNFSRENTKSDAAILINNNQLKFCY
ncbi:MULTISPECIES: ATP-dependent DNA helicase [unclassified Campylobacter]|uniref:ATP-dependent DNA helicase n=1 Tax=unclassified Campylobacter TaxID=2593542 RepID=UPI0022E9FF91|nr:MULTISPECIES: ATP-dependent RecD-like DNA helicase [unclassified Campylobacter]MDA3079642.1 ATP-dependent RecD-like DNA helicase [Campylobacter sp. CS_NA2]MDA3080926.1 ATP-dependent RecD-like DNA helicase [Campylobacter sp. CS_NA1]MDA3085477.1 ATP-dependent RecD-like DNA helicase [Campylobacter sp. CS_ED1]MDA3090474.1 ATP-dependent RecD-like DNA helicase [Campylobacter sp. CS_ED2]WBR50744.1 ATP-dependent RecD-like DNA helicase [Campylobacter sp. CS_NA3]